MNAIELDGITIELFAILNQALTDRALILIVDLQRSQFFDQVTSSA